MVLLRGFATQILIKWAVVNGSHSSALGIEQQLAMSTHRMSPSSTKFSDLSLEELEHKKASEHQLFILAIFGCVTVFLIYIYNFYKGSYLDWTIGIGIAQFLFPLIFLGKKREVEREIEKRKSNVEF